LSNLFASSAAFPNGIPPLGAPPSQTYVPVASIFQGFQPSCTLGNGNNSTNPDQCGPGFSGNVNGLIQLAVPLHWIAGTTQQWNFTIQREIGQDWFVELGYVGTKGTHLRSTYDPDQATLATAANPVTIPYGCLGGAGTCQIVDSTAENASARAPFLGIAPSDFEDFAPNSDSHYNALQATVAHHFSHGLYFQSAYTYSDSIDDVSTASVAFLTRYNNQTDGAASRGLSDFDRRHRFVTSGVYQLPNFVHGDSFASKAASGWEASGVLTLQSGAPFSVMDPAGGSAYALASPASTATFTSGSSCANAPSTGSITSRLSNWVRAGAYQSDPTLTLSNGAPSDATGYGDTPRNCIIGPPQKNVDFTLGKSFKIGERNSLRFRTDFFNLFNHPSFGIPVAPVVSPAGASAPITSEIGTPRLIQFSLKYSF